MHTAPRLYETFQPSHYSLELELNRLDRSFSGRVTVQGDRISDQPLALHSKELTIKSINVNDTDTPFSLSEYDQLLIGTDTLGSLAITIDFEGVISDGMHGLYPCYYEVDDIKQELLATQFESHHAREVFPCVDEPEAKASFDLTLVSESGCEVLSNMPISTQEPVEDKTKTVFGTTPKMSTYLLAFVVGDLQKKSATTASGVEVNIWSTKAQSTDSLDFPLEVAVGTVNFFDEYFDTPYPLPKVDHVALPDFSSGAMENWGLITYREIALLVDKNSSVSMREYVATVIAHETSHQWFGNLVTMKWWNDLWLNESFATIMEYVAVDALYPEWQTWNTFASQETLSALRRDQLAGVQAVKVEVNHPDEISTIFDPSIVYAKGARLLKMLRSYIGEDNFRDGLREYFKEHAYSNTVGADLWRAFSKSSGKDIESFMNTWIAQPGFPLVSLTTTNDGYALTQKRLVLGAKSNEYSVWPIPLFSYNNGLPELLESAEAIVKASHSLPLLNKGNDAHFIAEYDALAWEEIYAALENESLDIVTRLSLLHETSLLARSGNIDTATLIPLLQRYRTEESEPVWNIISMIIGDLRRFVENDAESENRLKLLITEIATPLYKTLGYHQIPNEPEQNTKLRATILSLLSYADHTEIIETSLNLFRSTNDPSELPSEIRAIICATTSKHGTEKDFDRLLDIHQSTVNAELRDDVTSGLCSTKDTRQIEQLLARLTDSAKVKRQDLFRWYIYLLRNKDARELSWQWMVKNWTWIEDEFRGDKSYDDFARYSANVLSTREWLTAYHEFFDPLRSQTVLKRAIEIGETEIDSRVEWLERDGESVRSTLAR